MQFMEEKMRQDRIRFQVPSVCGERLCGYAESFRELARSFEKKEPPQGLDRRSFFEEERLRENCGVIARHLMELADIMDQTAEEMTGLEPLEEKIWRRLLQKMRGKGLIMEGACRMSLGGKSGKIGQITLCLRTDREGGIPAREAEEILSSVLGKKYCLSLMAKERIVQEANFFLYVEEPVFVAFTGFARVIKTREEISGDNYSILQSERGMVTLLLSDGTGSGEKACAGSGWVLDLMEQLLEMGYCPETALKMVNATAVTKGEEVGHPTLDACRMNLSTGECYFYKAGGAVSFRKHGENVEVIPGGQLPLGIFQDLEPQRGYERLREGDSIILLTDGVLEAFREKGYEMAVQECLAGMEEMSPREMAEKLMQLAIFASEGNIRDDMTILVATLWKNP